MANGLTAWLRFSADAFTSEWKQSRAYSVMSILSVLASVFAAFVSVTNPIPSWSWQTRIIILLASLLVFLVVVNFAVYSFHTRTVGGLAAEVAEKHRTEAEGLRAEIQSLGAQIGSLKSEIAALTSHKLKFELDAPRSKVRVSYTHGSEGYDLSLALYVRFINADTHPLVVRSMGVSLFTVDEGGAESGIVKIDEGLTEMTYDEHSDAGWQLKGWRNIDLTVGGRESTLYHPIRGYIEVEREARRQFGDGCFLRVTMEAMNQPPYSLDFVVDWEGINQGWMGVTPRT